MNRPPELTVPQAAGLLNVSEEYLLGLIEAGEIASRDDGLVISASLLEYKRATDTRSRVVLDALSAETDELARQQPSHTACCHHFDGDCVVGDCDRSCHGSFDDHPHAVQDL